jgi:hypothetical protein
MSMIGRIWPNIGPGSKPFGDTGPIGIYAESAKSKSQLEGRFRARFANGRSTVVALVH